MRLRLRSHMPVRGIRVPPERDPESFKVCPPRPLRVASGSSGTPSWLAGSQASLRGKTSEHGVFSGCWTCLFLRVKLPDGVLAQLEFGTVMRLRLRAT